MFSIESLLTEGDAAVILHMNAGTLRNWRSLGVGPNFVKVGDAVRYAPDDLRRFIAARTRRAFVRAEARG